MRTQGGGATVWPCAATTCPRSKPVRCQTGRLAELVLAPSTPAEDAAEMLSCLIDSSDPTDASLEELRSKGSLCCATSPSLAHHPDATQTAPRLRIHLFTRWPGVP